MKREQDQKGLTTAGQDPNAESERSTSGDRPPEPQTGAAGSQFSMRRGIYVKLPDGSEVSRRDLIRKLFAEGLEGRVRTGSRSDIVRYLNEEFDQDILFQQVYQATADMQSDPRARGRRQIMVKLPDGKEVPRRDYMRQLFREGSSEAGIPPNDRGAIVKHMKSLGQDVTYQIVYQATS